MLGMTWADFAPYAWEYMVLPLLLTAVIAYFCGCFNGAVIVSKYILHDDVRTHGSGNAGLTNCHRTFGGPLTLVVILCDVLKAVAAIWAGVLIALLCIILLLLLVVGIWSAINFARGKRGVAVLPFVEKIVTKDSGFE